MPAATVPEDGESGSGDIVILFTSDVHGNLRDESSLWMKEYGNDGSRTSKTCRYSLSPYDMILIII